MVMHRFPAAFGALDGHRRAFSSGSSVESASPDTPTTLLFADGQLADVASSAVGSSDSWALVQGVQSVIETIHTTTGLPWWATLLATGVTFRAAVFPLFVYQVKATQRLMQARPDFSKLYSAYKYARTFLPPHDHKGHLDAILLGRKGLKLVMNKYNTRPVQTVLGSLVHVPLFVLLAYSARDMIRSGNVAGLESGGLLYWANLKDCDELYVLPLLACGSTYWNIELALRNKSQLWTQLGQGIQFLPLLALPAVSLLPQGVFFYWLGASWASMAQTLAMDNPAFRRRLGLPPRVAAPESRLAAAAANDSELVDPSAPRDAQKL
ncbi:hypothetical protein PybrP1_005009 [[Pythium] brassicae (nom. inval.)]|nr:hypothetical protein PybrP1_005009 [[Pythium] brassicae (nom. inval.)]